MISNDSFLINSDSIQSLNLRLEFSRHKQSTWQPMRSELKPAVSKFSHWEPYSSVSIRGESDHNAITMWSHTHWTDSQKLFKFIENSQVEMFKRDSPSGWVQNSSNRFLE